VRGNHQKEETRKYLHHGIANRSFERKFNLADYVEVTSADLNNGLLTISLVKEIPEAMKPRNIFITQAQNTFEHQSEINNKLKKEETKKKSRVIMATGGWGFISATPFIKFANK